MTLQTSVTLETWWCETVWNPIQSLGKESDLWTLQCETVWNPIQSLCKESDLWTLQCETVWNSCNPFEKSQSLQSLCKVRLQNLMMWNCLKSCNLSVKVRPENVVMWDSLESLQSVCRVWWQSDDISIKSSTIRKLQKSDWKADNVEQFEIPVKVRHVNLMLCCKPVRNAYKTYCKGWLENLLTGWFEALYNSSAKSDLIMWECEMACNLYSLCLTNRDRKDLQAFDASPQSLLCSYWLKIPVFVCNAWILQPTSHQSLLCNYCLKIPMFVCNAWNLQTPRLLILH